MNRQRYLIMCLRGLVHAVPQLAATLVLCLSTAAIANAQQVNGVPGSPSATEFPNSKRLPPPALKFGGVIKPSAVDSKPWWPPRIVPPKGAPNVLLIMTDDAGYGVSGTFGGVIPTPALDRIGKMGLRYTQFHSTALYSPTRAALITGRNHHSVGFGVITEQSTGYPGYDSIIGPDNATVGEILKENGYATSWFGKNHNTRAFSTRWLVLSNSGRSAWDSSTSIGSWAVRPISGHRICSKTLRRFPRGSGSPLQPHNRYGGRGDQVPART
jgi:arylsulfatase